MVQLFDHKQTSTALQVVGIVDCSWTHELYYVELDDDELDDDELDDDELDDSPLLEALKVSAQMEIGCWEGWLVK